MGKPLLNSLISMATLSVCSIRIGASIIFLKILSINEIRTKFMNKAIEIGTLIRN